MHCTLNEVYLLPAGAILSVEFHGRTFYLEQLWHDIEKWSDLVVKTTKKLFNIL